eukprot:UN08138
MIFLFVLTQFDYHIFTHYYNHHEYINISQQKIIPYTTHHSYLRCISPNPSKCHILNNKPTNPC